MPFRARKYSGAGCCWSAMPISGRSQPPRLQIFAASSSSTASAAASSLLLLLLLPPAPPLSLSISPSSTASGELAKGKLHPPLSPYASVKRQETDCSSCNSGREILCSRTPPPPSPLACATPGSLMIENTAKPLQFLERVHI